MVISNAQLYATYCILIWFGNILTLQLYSTIRFRCQFYLAAFILPVIIRLGYHVVLVYFDLLIDKVLFFFQAALIMQVLQLSDDQIAMLPPDQRQSILVLKEQIAKSTQR